MTSPVIDWLLEEPTPSVERDRYAEVVRLLPGHIESERMMVFVKGGKGDKDRYTLLSRKALEELRAYWRARGFALSIDRYSYAMARSPRGKSMALPPWRWRRSPS